MISDVLINTKTARVSGEMNICVNVLFVNSFPQGLEDVSKYPALIQELLQRNWTETELADVLRRNFLRVFEEVERVSSNFMSKNGIL